MSLRTTAKKMREQRASWADDAQKILDSALADNGRSLTAEEESRFDEIHGKISEKKTEIDRIERQLTVDDEVRAIHPHRSAGETDGGSDGDSDRHQGDQDSDEVRASKRAAFRSFLQQGVGRMPADQRALLTQVTEQGVDAPGISVPVFRTREEHRALTTQTGSTGGYTIAEDFANVLVENLLDFGGMRSTRAFVFPSATGADLPVPTEDDTGNEGEIIGENTTHNEQDTAFGVVTLESYTYSSKMVRVPVQLLQDSAFDIDAYLGRKLATRIARITNRHFTVGTGTGQPRGIMVAASVGKTTAANDTFTYEELVDLEHSVDPAYRGQAEFMFHDDVLAEMKKLSVGTTDNRPLWAPGIAVQAPDRILGYPFTVNQHCADIGTPENVIAAFGDFSYYWIRDVASLSLLRLVERYAEFLQVAFLSWSRHDGDLIDAGSGPVKTLKLAA